MKLVKNFVLAVLLVSTLALNTMAGEVQIPGYVPPPPPKDSVYDTDTQVMEAETSDNLFYEALAALLSVY